MGVYRAQGVATLSQLEGYRSSCLVGALAFVGSGLGLLFRGPGPLQSLPPSATTTTESPSRRVELSPFAPKPKA